MEPMNPAIAIDLGTTNTVIGVQTDETGPKIILAFLIRDLSK